VAEGLLFLGLFGAFVIWRRLSGLSFGALVPLVDFRPRASSAAVWAARAAIVAILLTAVGTRALRSQRERTARDAARLNAQGRHAEALRLADTADRWPSLRPGRLDIIRGEAYEALGEPTVAERYFLRAYEKDPTNFWAVADLAEFHAALDAPAADRRRLVEPYANELKRNFPRHERLNDVLARIERRLGQQ
jgi:tetratricopeptide (TPR) repeat protein